MVWTGPSPTQHLVVLHEYSWISLPMPIQVLYSAAQDMSEDVLHDGLQDGPGRRGIKLTVPQAAERLGITQDAVRKRIKRGYIGWEKDDEGRLYVWVDPTETAKETSSD